MLVAPKRLTQRLLPAEDPVYSLRVLSESSLTYLLLHVFGREPNERIEWSLPCCRAREAPLATPKCLTSGRVKIPRLAAAGRGMITRFDSLWQGARRIL
jgi:hypothetical protein